MRALITGSAGFIGFHLARRLLEDGHTVVGIDGLTPYYDPALKRARHAELARRAAFSAHEIMLEDGPALTRTVAAAEPDIIVHLAAQAGVRHSLEQPRAYLDANVTGTFNLLEAARAVRPRHLLLASTSSVYGANKTVPFHETDPADHPLSFYAATKRATELMAHTAAHLWDLPCTAFRFFTVYGPWGRPDMALFRFVEAISRGEPIDVYGHGQMERDFTYVDDLVEAVVRLLPVVPAAGERTAGTLDTVSPAAPYRVVNIGAGQTVTLEAFIAAVEARLGRAAIRRELPVQPGELVRTLAAPDLLAALTGYVPSTPLAIGVSAFVDWFETYRGSASMS